jgi:hypothetical protein
MIEKLNLEEVNNPGEATLKTFSILNQLVDTVNELQATISKMEKVETPAENVQDPYAEQHRWVGKLCKFWDNNYKITKHFGILTRIDETAIVRYEAENGWWYCACEPVKPDEDIIYKGE